MGYIIHYATHNMSNALTALEDYTGLTVTQAALLLGMPRSTYYQYRREDVPPKWITRHAQALMRMPYPMLQSLIGEHVHGDEL